MEKENTVLIVDDEKVNRLNLKKILEDSYEIVEAENGQQAIDILEKESGRISAIVLDLIMPVSNGYDFMKVYAKSKTFGTIPVVIATIAGDVETEKACLELGAWDFVGKPYDSKIIKFRIKNVIDRSQHQMSKELRYRSQYSELTAIYNMTTFYYYTRQMLNRYPEEKFAFIRLDIEKFRLVNAFFGREEGNALLKYVAEYLREQEKQYRHISFGHMNADAFSVCMAYDDLKEIHEFMKKTNRMIAEYPLDFELVMTYGIYLVDDPKLSVGEMYECANLASKKCKEMYTIQNYAFFEAKIREEVAKEQRIVNNMRGALKGNEFILYLQPKYELQSNTLAGAEVLVRWIDPERGMISPGDFIPVFEQNGFIMKLDYYVWEKTCQLLRRWLDEGRNPYPISVNVSRVSLYNPRLAEVLGDLVKQYDIPPRLLQLELTESAYTTNQQSTKAIMSTLQQMGFCILMDDFGSGYSSLNVLKDIEVDVLKIDMKFLSNTENEARSENILAAVVRMAKWLNLPVIAEGVERKEQVLFLRSIGCEFVQGYYFAKPMPVEEYEEIAFSDNNHFEELADKTKQETDEIWSSTSQLELLFSNMLQAVAVYEYGEKIEVLRVNNAYYDMFGFNDINDIQKSLSQNDEGNQKRFVSAFEEAVRTKGVSECEVKRHVGDREIWVQIRLKYMNQVGDKHIIYGYLSDITEQKEIDDELQKYRQAIDNNRSEEETILIVDDVKLNRAILRSIFKDRYRILEAENGREALELLEQEAYHVDIILLDLVMPEMDGLQFLTIIQQIPELEHIPVVIITADDTTEQQIDTMRMGADEYIIKPFIPEIVTRRVENVLNSSRSLRKVLRESNLE